MTVWHVMILNAWYVLSSPMTSCKAVRRRGNYVPVSSWLLQATSDLLELFTWEGPHGLSSYTSQRDVAQYQTSRSLIVGSFGDHNIIELTHDKIETYESSPKLFCGLF